MTVAALPPFRAFVWGQSTWNLTGLSPKRDCSPESAVPAAVARLRDRRKKSSSIFTSEKKKSTSKKQPQPTRDSAMGSGSRGRATDLRCDTD